MATCEFCNKNEPYACGWFYACVPNEFNQGTADTGLLQKRLVCEPCFNSVEIKKRWAGTMRPGKEAKKQKPQETRGRLITSTHEVQFPSGAITVTTDGINASIALRCYSSGSETKISLTSSELIDILKDVVALRDLV